MKVSLIQMNTQENLEANLIAAAKMIDQAVDEERCDMVVLPEMFTMLSESREAKRAAAEELPAPGEPGGRIYCRLQDKAREHGIIVHGGSLLEKAGAEYFNTTLVFDRDGTELARYRKIHLFDVVTPDGKEYRESNSVGRGDEVITFKADGRTVGLSICYDVRFPELYQQLAKKGAEIIVVPAAFTTQTGKDHWEVLLRARAIETETYVLAAGQTGSYANGQRSNYGHSLIADPWGHVIAMAQDKVGIVSAKLDFSYQTDVRQRIPVHQHKVL
jgi:predicted amidohydrolase